MHSKNAYSRTLSKHPSTGSTVILFPRTTHTGDLHCLGQKASSHKFQEDGIVSVSGKAGEFTVQGKNKVHTVDFGTSRGEGRCKYICFGFLTGKVMWPLQWMLHELRIVVHASIALTILDLAVQVEISNAVLYGSVQTWSSHHLIKPQKCTSRVNSCRPLWSFLPGKIHVSILYVGLFMKQSYTPKEDWIWTYSQDHH